MEDQLYVLKKLCGVVSWRSRGTAWTLVVFEALQFDRSRQWTRHQVYGEGTLHLHERAKTAVSIPTTHIAQNASAYELKKDCVCTMPNSSLPPNIRSVYA